MARGPLAGLWLAPHRPLFLLAGLWALLVPTVWLLPPGLGPEPLLWHRHELLFGMGGAALGGYLLTAVPAWTAGPRIAPATTKVMVALWLAGRVAFACGAALPLGGLIGAVYFLALAGILSAQVLRAGVWQRLPLALAPLVPGWAQMHDLPGEGIVLFFALLIGLIGGRAIAAFTRHALASHAKAPEVADPPWLAGGATLALVLAMAAQAEAPRLAGPLLIASGLMQLARMVAWRSWRAVGYPALLLLHLAWLWLPVGLVLAGAARLPGTGVAPATALHAITMGAMGSMMLAIMARAGMVRQGTRLLVSPALALGCGLVHLSVLPRLLMGWSGADPVLLRLAALIWMAGWALFLWQFRRALQGPVPRPVLSARSRA
ncbi:short-chain dehydrogenase [Paracoccus limosus]|uniref:Short-chain dehydrogenase n=1 Tax=Paracoccus limosus TaxID=913252 RepID=A0A844H5A5_9RHOB|nr:NnrS family protein [Paracoccus limosus]MTH35972.1 short-chain dehydrogenase [Paracoccus limosus]